MRFTKLAGAAVIAGGLVGGVMFGAGTATAATKLSMATSWSGGPPLESWAGGFAKIVEDITNGEVVIEVFTAGTLGSPLKVGETVRNGVAEVGNTYMGYEYGLDKTTVLVSGRPGGLNYEQMTHWLNEGGGLEMLREYRMETADLVSLPCAYAPREAGMFSTKKIETIKDFDGLKLRTAGAWSEIAAGLGVSTVVTPGAEVYQALERGVVDAVEWSTLSLNQSSGFHKIAPYIILPGFHQSVVIIECSFNKDVWAELSDYNKKLIEYAAYINAHRVFEETGNNDADAYKFFKDAGTEFVLVGDDVLEKVSELIVAWEDKTAEEEGGWFKKILDHQRAFSARWANSHEYRDSKPAQ